MAKMYQDDFVNHGSSEYVHDVYTNTIEGFWARLAYGVLRIYHAWAKVYLQDYIDEFVFRYNTHH